MNNSTKILLSIVFFIISAAIGFYGVKLIKTAIADVGTNPAASYGGGGGDIFPSANQGGSSVFPPSSESSTSVDTDDAFSNARDGSRKTAPSTKAPDVGGTTAGGRDFDTKLPANKADNKVEKSSSLADKVAAELKENNLNVMTIVSVSKPVYNEASKTYSFIVVAAGNFVRYGIEDAKKNLVSTQSDGAFTVKATTSGKYYVYVEDSSGTKSDYYEVIGCVVKVAKITAEELQSVLNSGDSSQATKADFKNRIKGGCKFVFEGRDESEGEAPISYNEILQRIKLKTWRSVTVKSVRHNSESGKLVQATIIVNY